MFGKSQAAGLIFSNIHDTIIPELTRTRTMASLPFGGRYRLVDFALSNLVGAGIGRVGIITHNNYRSLLDHIEDGRDWDLSRRSGGIKILPPYITAYDNSSSEGVYSSRLEALGSVMNFVSGCAEEHLILSDCDVVLNIDISALLRQHCQSRADLTVVVGRVMPGSGELRSRVSMVSSEPGGRICDFAPPSPHLLSSGEVDISLNIMAVNRQYLQSVVLDTIAHGGVSFERDLVGRRLGEDNYYVFRHEGYFALINSLESYYARSMELLDSGVRRALFGVGERPVLSCGSNMPPAIYSEQAKVQNSLVADGCIIEGTVENSLLFRGVKVGRGSVVRDSILFDGTYVGQGASVGCVVSEKRVLIKDGRRLEGHISAPFFIGKDKIV